MKKKILILLIKSIILVNIFTQNLKLPIEIPSDALNPLTDVLEKTRKYSLRYVFNLDIIKNETKKNTITLLIPMPPSNDFQKIKIKETVNFAISNISHDVFGNPVIITDVIDLSKVFNNLEVIFEITINKTNFNPVKNVTYKIIKNEFFTKHYDSLKKNVLPAVADSKGINNYNELLLFIESFKNKVNMEKTGTDKIYDAKTISFYPISNEKYFIKGKEFLTRILEKNISGRISFGYYIPEKINTFSREIFIEIFLNDYGNIILDKYLNPLINNGDYILNYSEPAFDHTNYFENYLAFFENENLTFINTKQNIFISEIINTDKQGKVTWSNYDTVNTRKIIDINAINNFLIQDNSIKNGSEKFSLLKKVNIVNKVIPAVSTNIINEITFCRSIKNNLPVDKSKIFNSNEIIYAYIGLSNTDVNKKIIVKWIMPDKKIFYTLANEVPKNWLYTYYYVKPDENKLLQKGEWSLEIYLDGRLTKKDSFEIK